MFEVESYPQGHDDVFVVVGGVAGEAHLGLGVAVFELELDARAGGRFADADLVAVGLVNRTGRACGPSGPEETEAVPEEIASAEPSESASGSIARAMVGTVSAAEPDERWVS